MNRNRLSLGALVLAMAGSATAANATEAESVATTLTGIISTYGGALTGVVVAGVVLRFTWKWIRAVR